MASELNVSYLGSVPLDPIVTRSCDEGLNPLENILGTAFHASLKSVISSTLLVHKFFYEFRLQVTLCNCNFLFIYCRYTESITVI